MNHYLLAEAGAPTNDVGRYGNVSTPKMIALVEKLLKGAKGLEASIFGGAAVNNHLSVGGGIGERNIEVAREILGAHRIPVRREDVGGTVGRRIYFNTESGEIEVRVNRNTDEAKRLADRRAEISSRNTRVLVVDDSPLVRKVLCRAIGESNGIEVCGEAEDAFEARDLILSTDPDVISLDIIMPKMDGLKFLRKLSQHFPKPVVICSTIAKDESDIARKAIEYGAVDVVDKETLELYKGMEVVKGAYVPKLKQAAIRVVRKKVI
jgi:two-component system chemotaxis response regulator CheB